MKNLSLMICLWIAGIVVMGGCKKPIDDIPQTPAKNYKFTVKSTGIIDADYIRITFVGISVNGNVKTTMKVDGVEQSNQTTIELTRAQITSSTGVVIESTQPIFQMGFVISGQSGTPGHTFNLKVDPIVNGTAAASVNKTFTTETFSQDYSY